MKLSQIYKAHQCSDLSDVEMALTDLRNLAASNDYNFTKSMVRRLTSLEKKRLYLIGEQERPYKGKNGN